ncbi:hypothetical protein EAJSRFBN_CDS0082 [Salmonella phage SeKF_19]|uniref:Uncharacterized protein n=5 Tax=Caudoviricetes TaxID=2731619 RepID=A0AAU8GMN4_9CAUD
MKSETTQLHYEELHHGYYQNSDHQRHHLF